ncbi:MAG: glycosyltransferase family 1 protein, partial [Bacteroidota bacterium]|nr:glycosyltransferase family 1 protein [Bacteroidota bacterium]
YIWFEFSIPYILKKHKIDIFVSPDGYTPLRSKVPSLSVFHDLNFEHYPEDLPKVEKLYYQKFFPKYAKKTTRIATVSEFSKQDICKQYSIDPNKIDVVYNGSNTEYKPLSKTVISATKKQYSNGKEYFLFVGSLHPRKNLTNLFKAFDKFKRENNSDIKLLLVGASKWWTPEIKNTFDSLLHKKDIVICGRLSTEELRKVLGSALSLTYVSYFEGFGIPIVEAFYSGVSVITSNCTSMPEVAGDAAIIIDPFSVEDISDAMKKIAFDKDLRQRLIIKGHERAKVFTWQKTADRLWYSIIKTSR